MGLGTAFPCLLSVLQLLQFTVNGTMVLLNVFLFYLLGGNNYSKLI